MHIANFFYSCTVKLCVLSVSFLEDYVDTCKLFHEQHCFFVWRSTESRHIFTKFRRQLPNNPISNWLRRNSIASCIQSDDARSAIHTADSWSWSVTTAVFQHSTTFLQLFACIVCFIVAKWT